MLGCALCMLEREKRHRGFSQTGLCNLLQVLNFLRIMMQVLQQHEHLCWHVYNGEDLVSALSEMVQKCRFSLLHN